MINRQKKILIIYSLQTFFQILSYFSTLLQSLKIFQPSVSIYLIHLRQRNAPHLCTHYTKYQPSKQSISRNKTSILKTPLRFIQQLPIKKTRTIYPLQSAKPHLNIPRNTAQAFLPSPLISNDFETRNFSHCRRVEPRIIRLRIPGGRLHAGIIIHWREIKATLIFERVKLFLLVFDFSLNSSITIRH